METGENRACAQDRNAQSCCPEKYSDRQGSEGGFGADEISSKEKIAKALVATRDAGERRARSATRRLQTEQPEENRGFAERSSRRKAGAYRSALSMLTFYINRAGTTLPKTQRDRLQRAKTELKHQFHRDQ